MEDIIATGRTMSTFGRRLSRLYNDTKKSSDFVKDAVQHVETDPEIKALHRKLRIQKDRLVSWGLEWSDPNQPAEIMIDSSLSKAGLSEVVGSVMSTIKDILAEAEPLWQASRRLIGEKGPDFDSGHAGEKVAMTVWDKKKFEDLVRDLTTSIDTLYDLSRTRSSYAQASAAARERMFKSVETTEESRAFESSRLVTPKQIDPRSLTNLRSLQAEPMTEADEGERHREIVFMSKEAFARLTKTMPSSRQQNTPLLLEYAPFDPIYASTGIPPPMARFEKLSTGLQTEPQRIQGSWTGLPGLLGYFEDMNHSRLGLVYHFPPTFHSVTFEHLTQHPLYNLCSLADLLARPDFEPKLEAKFRLASNLANTVFDLQARGIVHGNLVGSNISFCNAVGTDPEVSGTSTGDVDIRRPLVSSFDLFSEPRAESEPCSSPLLYKHPLDPRVTAKSPLASNPDSKTLDLYSLAMVLVSIGLWTKLENLVEPGSPAVSEFILDQVAIRCGTLYMKAVQACWNAVDQELTRQMSSDKIVARVQFKASRYLEACCILDGVSNLDERLGNDLGEAPAAPKPAASSSKDTQRGQTATDQATTQAVEPPAKPTRPKTRFYPQVSLPTEAVEYWNSVLMPQVNGALRHFYRKNVESVEISLESVGESAQSTTPTVLVVCTSVSKVRAILQKKLGALFDGTTGYALKVCRGSVLRSKNQGSVAATSPQRSAAKQQREEESEMGAANPEYQERPKNGASISAWIDDRHLPPVSFGGMILVDDKPYGMTVHHMLDDPEQADRPTTPQPAIPRSKASGARPGDVRGLAAWYAAQHQQDADFETDHNSAHSDNYACEFSDSGSVTLESAMTSNISDLHEDKGGEGEQFQEPGDIPGVEPGCGEGYLVTQPALDDVEEGFYPSAETQDEDHLYTFGLGEIYASSGIRRRADSDGLLHEIDWALFEFVDDRLPRDNAIPRMTTQTASALPELSPTAIIPTTSLPNRQVQCMARTSGLQTGLILPVLTSIKLFGRESPSQSYQISAGALPAHFRKTLNSPSGARTHPTLPLGVPGDSGAWIVSLPPPSFDASCSDPRLEVLLAGHVLAWSERKRVAYFCPIQVLFEDIAETLGARDVRLPGSAHPLVTCQASILAGKRASARSSLSFRTSRPLSLASFASSHLGAAEEISADVDGGHDDDAHDGGDGASVNRQGEGEEEVASGRRASGRTSLFPMSVGTGTGIGSLRSSVASTTKHQHSRALTTQLSRPFTALFNRDCNQDEREREAG